MEGTAAQGPGQRSAQGPERDPPVPSQLERGQSGDKHSGDKQSGDKQSGEQAGNGQADELAMRAVDAVIPDSVGDKPAMRRRLGHVAAYVFSFGILALAIFVLVRTFLKINVGDLRAAIAETSGERIALAFLFTTLSFLALTGYDALALRQLKLRVPYRTTALASFTSYAISFTLGFPIITAGTVRYWIYSTRGLSAGKVASLTVIAGLTFWLGMVLVIGIGFVVRGAGLSHLDHLDPLVNRLIGAGVIAVLVGYLVWTARGKRHATIQGFKLELPGFRLTAGQLMLGLVDLSAAAATLYVLLSPPRSIDYISFVAVYVFGSLLGIASNAPGGIGVFEATMLKTVPAHSQAALFAALLLFRAVYYFVPFVLALALLGAHESLKRWTSLRAAMGGNDDDDPEGDTTG